MDKNTKILLGVGALALVGYFILKSAKKTMPEIPETPQVFPKDSIVLTLIADADNRMLSNEDDLAVWGDLYHELYKNAELDVTNVNNTKVLSAKESSNVSKDVQTKAIEYLQKISEFTSNDFSEQQY